MAGRKPVPTALKLIRGNPGRRPLNAAEPKPERAALAPPAHLAGLARAEWERLAPMLDRVGVLSELDARALELYCQNYAAFRDATDKIDKMGSVILTPSGCPVQNPYVGVANRAQDMMLKILAEFGMTPSARSRVKVDKPRAGNPFANLG